MSGAILALALVMSELSAVPDAGGRQEPTPPALIDIDVIEQLGADVPTHLPVRDETGNQVQFGSLFETGKPVILTFNYAKCPVLCGVQLGGLVELLQNMRWSPGTQFKIITLSLDPEQTASTTASQKATYLSRYNRPGTSKGWRFVTATPDVIAAITSAVGVKTGYYAPRDEYVHPAVLTILTPERRVASYVYGVKFDPAVVATALTNAALGASTESAQRFILSCLHYEPNKGYAAHAEAVMRYAGIGFAVFFGAGLVYLRLRTS